MSYGRRKEFYHSQAWRRTRDAYIKERFAADGGLCEVCHERLGDTVHHIIWLTEINVADPEVALTSDNFRLVCRECHAKEKDPAKIVRNRRYEFDADGNVIRPPFSEKK